MFSVLKNVDFLRVFRLSFLIISGGFVILVSHHSEVFADKLGDLARSPNSKESEWVDFVGKFREKHNISVMVAAGKTSWSVREFSSLRDQSVQSDSAHIVFRYSFHQQIQGSFGFALGSSLSLVKDSFRPIDDFKVGLTLRLPGLFAGLVYNINSRWRGILGASVSLERVYGITDESNEPSKVIDISMHPDSASLSVAIDFFWKWKEGLRFVFNADSSAFNPPSGAGDGLLGASLAKSGRWVAVGPIYHFD